MKEGFFKNPLNISHIGDPFVLKAANGTYYCYPTSSPEGYKAWSSIDLVNWRGEGFVFKKSADSWAASDFWAPEVVEYERKYYMYYTGRWKVNGSLRIGLAVSDSPLGPFIEASNMPFFDFGYAAIDAHVLIDDDNRKYIYFSKDCSENIVEGRHESHIYGAELEDNMLSLKTEPILLTKPDQAWEMKSGPDWLWNEGPFVLKKKGLYYLMYSANCYASKHYSVGYAEAEHPLGPYVKYENNPVLKSECDEISGPGHHSVTVSPDGRELFIVYHTHTDPKHGGGDRQVCIDRMHFNEDGSISVMGPTLDNQPMPSK